MACEVIGMPVIDGRIPNIRDARLPSLDVSMSRIPPIVMVSGTCMDSGKDVFPDAHNPRIDATGIPCCGG